MKIPIPLAVAPVVLLWFVPCEAANDGKAADANTWRVAWQWTGDSLPPVLKLTFTNSTGAPVLLTDWELTGKDADRFAFEANKPPASSTCESNQSVAVRLAWNGFSSNSPAEASLRLVHEVNGANVTHDFDLREPTSLLPQKYRIEGFLEKRNQPLVRDARGRLVVHDTYHDGPMIERLLTAFAEDYPRIASLREIGETWHGRKILGLRITSGMRHECRKPAFLFVGAHHANEPWSTEVVLDIIHQLATGYASNPEVRRWVDQYEIWCVPLVNPDGLHNFFHVTGRGRKNGRDTNDNGLLDASDGVDLNRNYPYRWHSLNETGSNGDPAHGRYRGPSAGSEPETKAVMRLADRERFVMLISYHTSGSKVLVPYTIDGARNPHPDAAWIVGAHLAALSDTARLDRDYTPVRKLYSVDGVDQDWHYWRHGTLAYLWEGPETLPSLERREKMIVGARPGWQYLLRRLEEGPTLSGHVHDGRTGKPIEAAVSIDEIETFEGEVHASHPETGRFDRVLPIEGTYHLRVEKSGYRPALFKTCVGRQWKHVRVHLWPRDEETPKQGTPRPAPSGDNSA